MQWKLASAILLAASSFRGVAALCDGSNWAIGEKVQELFPGGALHYFVYVTTPDQRVNDEIVIPGDGNICTHPQFGCSPPPIFINKYISKAGITYNCFRDPVDERVTQLDSFYNKDNKIQSCCRRA
ncbi:hypothetical protein FA13DRAFT_1813795 [Coprinellus micaceus]|uniref:Uncharacterized protein n=1 Tax=Coprinellus micaceus TaxID=71717 RepID=A0A4Y7TC93_COPMI|nr:hypothetical protein FA13DRAFT_1813795 [Coprinellus micaceus]